MKLSDGNYGLYSYNFFHEFNDRKHIQLTYIWKPDNLVSDIQDVFTPLDDLQGYEFKIATNPWSHHVLGEEIPAEEGGTAVNKYRNYFGYEIDLLQTLAKNMNFTYRISNPHDGLWGHIEADGSWSGLIAYSAFNLVDFAICDIFITYTRTQVIDGTITFDVDYMVFAAPKPQLLPKYTALIMPFDAFVWIVIAGSLIIISFMAFIVASTEQYLRKSNVPLGDWWAFENSFFYCVGTLLGESITNYDRSQISTALR